MGGVIPVEEVVPIEKSDPELGRLLGFWIDNFGDPKKNPNSKRCHLRSFQEPNGRQVVDIAAYPRGWEPGRSWYGGRHMEAKVERNEPCPCGSCRKYKKCCMQN